MSRTVVLAVNPGVMPQVEGILRAGAMRISESVGGDGVRVRVHEFVAPCLPSRVVPEETPVEVAERLGMPERMFEALVMLADGLAVKQIGREMGIAECSAKSHCARLYRFLRVNGAPAAVAEGFRLGLLTGGES
ncbi:LuxR C-terminal-related transcriptional regulator [Amycolatopsis sp. NPDC049159]|uniref:LuxR C-terminal-related transcriptional regulator n=1 Tax=Amycolatopsis sp. NPDC049159 TaxID=3157210 RepID=UPI0033D0263D